MDGILFCDKCDASLPQRSGDFEILDGSLLCRDCFAATGRIAKVASITASPSPRKLPVPRGPSPLGTKVTKLGRRTSAQIGAMFSAVSGRLSINSPEVRPRCKTCDTGTLIAKQVYRLGSIVALIGYIILLPSVLAMALMGSSCVAGMGRADAEVGVIVGGLGAVGFILAFVSGLLGWILILKKSILQCDACGATVAAS